MGSTVLYDAGCGEEGIGVEWVLWSARVYYGTRAAGSSSAGSGGMGEALGEECDWTVRAQVLMHDMPAKLLWALLLVFKLSLRVSQMRETAETSK